MNRNKKVPSVNIWNDVDWQNIVPRLSLYAAMSLKRFPNSRIGDPNEFVSQAIEKTISGTRIWNAEKVGLIGHLLGVISSDIYNEIRKESTYSSVEFYELLNNELESSEYSPEDLAARNELLTMFLDWLKKSDGALYEWFLLSALFELNSKEIASELNLKPKDIVNNRKRIKRYIEKFLKQNNQNNR